MRINWRIATTVSINGAFWIYQNSAATGIGTYTIGTTFIIG